MLSRVGAVLTGYPGIVMGGLREAFLQTIELADGGTQASL